MHFPTLALFSLLGSALASKLPISPERRQQDQLSTIETRIADVAGIEAAIATASGEVTAFSDAVAAFDGATSENSLAFLTSFSRLGISVNSVSQTVLVSGLLNVADSAAVYPDVALFTTSLSRAVGGVQAKVSWDSETCHEFDVLKYLEIGMSRLICDGLDGYSLLRSLPAVSVASSAPP